MKKRVFNRITAAALVLLLLLGSLCACGTPAAQETETETAVQETEVTEPTQNTAAFGLSYVKEYGLHPYNCTCLTNRPIINLLFEGLFVVNEQFQPEPVLCDKFGVSDDGLTYLITLRSQATFSDGTAVTPEDVVYSLRKAANSKYYGGRFHFVRSFSVFNSRTVEVDLYTPYETLPLLLDVPICKNGTADDSIPVGSGPFLLREGSPTLHRVADWWQGEYSVIPSNTVQLKTAAEPLDVRDSFEFGSTNLVLADPNSAASVGYRCDYELWNSNTTAMLYLGYNTASATFSNRSLRKAITWLIDRETVCAKIYNGFAYPASLPCSPQCSYYDETLAAQYAYSPEAFFEWRKANNIPSGTKAELLVWSADYSRVELANLIADTLTDYGINVQIVAVDIDKYKARLKSGNFDLFLGEVRLSPDFDLSEFFAGDGDLNFGGITSSEAYQMALNSLANSGNTYDLYQTVMDNALFCPILFKSYAVMVTRGTISSLQPAVDNVFHLPGGRTLADAATTYEEIYNGVSSTAAPTTEPPTEPTSPAESKP